MDMVASRSGTAGVASPAADLSASERGEVGRQRLIAVGGIFGALAASSCCIVPLTYKPIFVAGTADLLGYGFYLVYWKPRRACADGAACSRPIPSRLVQLVLWMATALVIAAFAFDYVAPLLLRN